MYVNTEGDLIVSEEILGYYDIDGLYQFTHVDHIQTIFRVRITMHTNSAW